jgi:hypothetical protein
MILKQSQAFVKSLAVARVLKRLKLRSGDVVVATTGADS